MKAARIEGRAWRLAAAAIATLFLVSCATPRVRPDADLMVAQEQRELALSAIANWSLTGRLALSGPKDSGSGTLSWQQTGDEYRFRMHAPVTGKTWILTGDTRGAELTGLQSQPLRAQSASTLLERELGWKVPVIELARWVRGLRSEGPATISFRPDGLPAEVRQDGWVIEYRDYDETQKPALPRRIFASNGQYKVRLAIQQWE